MITNKNITPTMMTILTVVGTLEPLVFFLIDLSSSAASELVAALSDEAVPVLLTVESVVPVLLEMVCEGLMGECGEGKRRNVQMSC
jgi:hypothetical protein